MSLTSAHLIGIGGAGMSAIARILLGQGARVSGSDAKESATCAELRKAGAQVAVGHDAANLQLSGQSPEVVVISKKAIPEDNPELVAAREQGIEILTRSQVLGRLARVGRSIMVCGTHGKTSTTSMLISGLLAARTDPSFAVGGTVLSLGTNARGGSDPIFVAEADESDGSLVDYEPDVVILTNAEPDHLDHFSSAEEYFQVFDDFIARIPDTGALVACLDDPGAAERARRAAARGITVVGYSAAPTALAEDLQPLVDAELGEMIVGSDSTKGMLRVEEHWHRFAVGVPGTHMLLNATAALLAARQIEVMPGAVSAGLAQFTGVGRRFELKGEAAGVRVYDDYAHHPTEVRAVLDAGRKVVDEAGAGRLVALFQPHMYSRTRIFAAEFGAALSLADQVVVTAVYGARELPEEGVDAALVASHVTTEVMTAENLDDLTAKATALLQPGDVCFTIGAGDITSVGPRILEALAETGR